MPHLIELSRKTISDTKLKRLLKITAEHLQISRHQKPMIAIIMRGKRIIGIGTNKSKTHPQQARHSLYKKECKSSKLHAEIAAINNTPINLVNGADIYVLRIKRGDGSLGISTPCPACMSACIEAGIRRIYYIEETTREENK